MRADTEHLARLIQQQDGGVLDMEVVAHDGEDLGEDLIQVKG